MNASALPSKKSELTRRHRDGALRRLLPRCREARFRELLLEQTEPDAVEPDHLRALPVPRDEQEDSARERVILELSDDSRSERSKAAARSASGGFAGARRGCDRGLVTQNRGTARKLDE